MSIDDFHGLKLIKILPNLLVGFIILLLKCTYILNIVIEFKHQFIITQIIS